MPSSLDKKLFELCCCHYSLFTHFVVQLLNGFWKITKLYSGIKDSNYSPVEKCAKASTGGVPIYFGPHHRFAFIIPTIKVLPVLRHTDSVLGVAENIEWECLNLGRVPCKRVINQQSGYTVNKRTISMMTCVWGKMEISHKKRLKNGDSSEIWRQVLRDIVTIWGLSEYKLYPYFWRTKYKVVLYDSLHIKMVGHICFGCQQIWTTFVNISM